MGDGGEQARAVATGPEEMLQSGSDLLIIIDYVNDLRVWHEVGYPAIL